MSSLSSKYGEGINQCNNQVTQVAKMEDQSRKDMAVARAAAEKEKLKDLLESRKRPQVDELPDGSEVYALNIQFTKKWRSFLE